MSCLPVQDLEDFLLPFQTHRAEVLLALCQCKPEQLSNYHLSPPKDEPKICEDVLQIVFALLRPKPALADEVGVVAHAAVDGPVAVHRHHQPKGLS